MAIMGILMLFVILYLFPVIGAILVVVGIVKRVRGLRRMKENPSGQHLSAAWLVFLIIGIALIVMPLLLNL